jgi:hypothetical protein
MALLVSCYKREGHNPHQSWAPSRNLDQTLPGLGVATVMVDIFICPSDTCKPNTWFRHLCLLVIKGNSFVRSCLYHPLLETPFLHWDWEHFQKIWSKFSNLGLGSAFFFFWWGRGLWSSQYCETLGSESRALLIFKGCGERYKEGYKSLL